MKKIYYLKCPLCAKEYYIDRELYSRVKNNPAINLVCPFCKKEFNGKDAKFIDT